MPMESIKEKIESILQAHLCVQKNEKWQCAEPRYDNDAIRHFFKRSPRLYEFLVWVTSTIYYYGISADKALCRAFPEGIENKTVINLGSGTSDFGPHVINVDIIPLPTVNIIADAAQLPFYNKSIDMILSESTLEHVSFPEKAMEEIRRVVKKGGFVYLELPFVFPYHASPNDYTRWTIEGLKIKFSDFEVIAAGARSGPIAALIIQLVYVFALVFSFGSQMLYQFLIHFFMVFLSPLKIFDLLCRPFTRSSDGASLIYFFARKT